MGKCAEPTSITNENFRFPEKPTVNSEEALLQSPIETHFANTPQSKSQSPANGFTSQDCSDILCQELDKLDKEQILSVQADVQKPTELKLDMVTVESIMSPTEENISMFTITKEEIKEVEEKVVEIEECAPGQVSFRGFFFVFFFVLMFFVCASFFINPDLDYT